MLTPIVAARQIPQQFTRESIWEIACLQVTEDVWEEVSWLFPMEPIYFRILHQIDSVLREEISAD